MDKELAESIGNAARVARRRLKLTQADVAERIEVSEEFYARLERGNALPSLTTLARLSVVLRVRPDVLLGRAPSDEGGRGRRGRGRGRRSLRLVPPLPEPEDPPVLRRLQRRLRRASPEALRLIKLILKALEDYGGER
ncbi:helix-turn-helix domain-containing protein [Haliangium ochraceum]|uniref:Transcriptional regulator, XRE family n=1 Tax=Haliangium ochraceum (strain DSM 14365 / JCM 11303 / SMP-2) TaxID=502025 RepID=D0LQC1_HALO1|nr:helix-turn-helix transcriptional regulator [Haliangium ochraceum]ACY18930.1 transcriptional regulator, XRE family [Haliangium ochraceum DSM 14365]